MLTPAPSELIELFAETGAAVRSGVARLSPQDRRSRTGRPGQYGLDVVADIAARRVLQSAPVRIVSEESGISGEEGAEVTVVIDPVDASTNCARGISYWATAICALDHNGPLAAYVVNQATGSRFHAVRGEGAWRDGERIAPSAVTRVEDAVVALSGFPARMLAWAQYRALGCCALALCDLAAGGLDGYVDGGSWHAPWDYLAGLLICREAGAQVVSVGGDELVTADVRARRQLLGAATVELLHALRPATGSRR